MQGTNNKARSDLGGQRQQAASPPEKREICWCRTYQRWAHPEYVSLGRWSAIEEARRIFPEMTDGLAPPNSSRIAIELRRDYLPDSDQDGRVYQLYRYRIVEIVENVQKSYRGENTLVISEYSGCWDLAMCSLANAMLDTASVVESGSQTVAPLEASRLNSYSCTACGMSRI